MSNGNGELREVTLSSLKPGQEYRFTDVRDPSPLLSGPDYNGTFSHIDHTPAGNLIVFNDKEGQRQLYEKNVRAFVENAGLASPHGHSPDMVS